MKGSIIAIAAAIASGVSAHAGHRRHAHEAFHMERGLYASASNIVTAVTGTGSEGSCGCTTVYYTSTGAPTRTSVPLP